MQKKISFHPWKKQLLFIDKIISIIVLILMGFFNPNFLIITAYFLLFPYLILTKRISAIKHLILASAVALIWMIFAHDYYGYNFSTFNFFGLNSFGLFAWAAGLFVSYLLYSHWEYKIQSNSLWKKLLLFIFLYWITMLFAETFAYHVLDIKNLTNAVYSGLPICNCLHAPNWMKIAYFLIGPIYFLFCELLGFENPHHKK